MEPQRLAAFAAGEFSLHSFQQFLSVWDMPGSSLTRIPSAGTTASLTPTSPRRIAAAALQRKKLIAYTRGAVEILNRKKLENSACECYGVMRQYDGELVLK